LEILNPVTQDTDILVDGTLLREAIRQRRRSWIAYGPAIFLIIAGLLLFVMPQSYTASASVSVQQSSASISPLAFLAGVTVPKKYIGILHSRKLAESAERQFHLQSFYHLPSKRKAVELLMESVKPEDSAGEGLLFVRVTLNGPPRWWPDPIHRGERAKALTAAVANYYVTQLDSYYASSDNDHDTVLLNAADQQLQRARDEYHLASARLRAFVIGMRRDPVFALPSSNESSPSAVPGAIQSLYEEAERAQAEIAGAEAAREARESAMQRQLSGLAVIPADDPFLFIARDNLNRARLLLKTLRDAEQLSDDNPRVVTARDRVRIAQEDLAKQEEGYRNGITTESIVAETRLQSLRARRDSIFASIHNAEIKVPGRRERSIDMLELQKDQEIALKALQATEEETAKLKLTLVPGHSRISLVDPAILPDGGQPRMLVVVLLALAGSILLFFPVVVLDYVRLSRKTSVNSGPAADMARAAEAQPDLADNLSRNGKNNP